MRSDFNAQQARGALVFSSVIELVEEAGYRWKAGSNVIWVLPKESLQVTDPKMRLFSISKYGDHWFLDLADQSFKTMGVYRVPTQADMLFLVTRILSNSSCTLPPMVADPEQFFAQSKVVPVSVYDRLNDNIESTFREREKYGWKEMSRAEEDALWNRLERELPDLQRGKGPSPFRRWDTSIFYENEDLVTNVYEPDFTDKFLAALRMILLPTEYVYVLVWDSESYRFFPHAAIPGAYNDYWARPPLHLADSTYFLDRTFRFGALFHREAWVCIFGELLQPLESLKPQILSTLVQHG
jgi:hypothetical protein